MIATLLSTLFVAAAFLALGAIADSWRSHGKAVLALREQLRALRQTREVRYTLVMTEVGRRELSAPRYAVTLPLAAGPVTAGLPFQPSRRAA